MKSTISPTLAAAIVIGLVIIAAVVIHNKMKTDTAPAPKGGDKGNNGNGNQPTPNPKGLNVDLLLKRGSTGKEVEELQRLLNTINSNLNVDGNFGAMTEAALDSAQGVKETTLKKFTSNINLFDPLNIPDYVTEPGADENGGGIWGGIPLSFFWN